MTHEDTMEEQVQAIVAINFSLNAVSAFEDQQIDIISSIQTISEVAEASFETVTGHEVIRVRSEADIYNQSDEAKTISAALMEVFDELETTNYSRQVEIIDAFNKLLVNAGEAPQEFSDYGQDMIDSLHCEFLASQFPDIEIRKECQQWEWVNLGEVNEDESDGVYSCPDSVTTMLAAWLHALENEGFEIPEFDHENS